MQDTAEQPYLSIVAWPAGSGRAQVADLLGHAGFDRPTMMLRLGQAPPMVLGPVDPGAGASAVDAILRAGGDAMLNAPGEWRTFGRTMPVKKIAVQEGQLVLELHAGVTTAIGHDAIDLLVRGQLAKTETILREGPRFGTADLETSFSVQHAYEQRVEELRSRRVKRTTTVELLDLHAGESIYQVDGRRFSYACLGALRGHGDKPNTDQVAALLRHLAPDAIYDDFYKLWKPPTRYEGVVPLERDESPDFAFYSRWTALVYRHVMEQPTSVSL